MRKSDLPEVPGWTIIEDLASAGACRTFAVEQNPGSLRGVLKMAADAKADSTQLALTREIELLQSLSHPGIVRLLDHGTIPDRGRYLITERLEGGFPQLATEDDAEKLRIFAALVDTLAYLHSFDVVHRDLKPEHIRLRASGEPVLIDFGAASGGVLANTTTVQGQLTPVYASPEQLLGQPVTPASDIYQCGLILHELVQGTHPFLAGDPELPHPEWIPRLHAASLDRIAVRCLAPDPESRYSDAGALAHALRRGAPEPRSRTAWKVRGFMRRNGRWVALAAVALLLALVAMGFARNSITRMERDRIAENSRLLDGWVREVVTPMEAKPGTVEFRTTILKQIEKTAATLEPAAVRDEELARQLVDYYHRLASVHGEVFAPHSGQYEMSLGFAKRALALIEHHLKNRQQDEYWLLHKGNISMLLGDILFGAQRWQDALTAYRNSHQTWQALQALRPNDENARWTITVAKSMEGDVLAEMGHPEKSLPLQADVLKIRRAQMASGLSFAPNAVASALESTGDCLYRLRNWSASRMAFEEAILIRERYIDSNQDPAEAPLIRRNLAQAYIRVSRLESAAGDSKRAQLYFRKARAALDKAIALEPNPQFDRRFLSELESMSGAKPTVGR